MIPGCPKSNTATVAAKTLDTARIELATFHKQALRYAKRTDVWLDMEGKRVWWKTHTIIPLDWESLDHDRQLGDGRILPKRPIY
jgi:hypothetical protein